MRNDINIMPGLPEVEITLRGIKPHILHQVISHVIVRYPRLRWPIEPHINQLVKEQTVQLDPNHYPSSFPLIICGHLQKNARS